MATQPSAPEVGRARRLHRLERINPEDFSAYEQTAAPARPGAWVVLFFFLAVSVAILIWGNLDL